MALKGEVSDAYLAVKKKKKKDVFMNDVWL